MRPPAAARSRLAQSPEAWYAWSTKVLHELHYGRLDDAFFALAKVLRSRGSTDARIARIESGIRNPATRVATIEQLGRDGDYYEALIFARFLISDDASVDLLERLVRDNPKPFLDLYVYITLSPKSRASARVQAIGAKLGWTPTVR